MFCKNLCLTFACFLMVALPSQAQVSPIATDDFILFVWNDTLFAQALADSRIITMQEHFTRVQPMPPSQYGDVVDVPDTLVTHLPDGYGFYQGVWSAEGTRFDFLAIRHAEYQVITVEDGIQRTLVDDEAAAERGYLVPVGWDTDNNLILLERHMLHNLEQVRLWQYSESDSSLRLRQVIETPPLQGNSISLADGWVYIGFDTARSSGYVINLHTGQLLFFPTGFGLQDPPASVFETYPVEVIGVVNTSALQNWMAAPSGTDDTGFIEAVLTPPFLYWPLPDYARSITCYPDSAWTDLRFSLECPGLTVPREYPGHEGTDIGGRPNGLPVGTPVCVCSGSRRRDQGESSMCRR